MLVSSTLIALVLSVGVGEPPSPQLGPHRPGPEPAPGVIEGPARAPEPAPEPETERESEIESEPGIEFATNPPPSTDELESDGDGDGEADVEAPAAEPAAWWPDPGRAPPDGSGGFVWAGVLIPTAAIVTWGLLLDSSLSSVDQVGIVVAGSGMGLLAVGALGVGIHRRLELVRWANAYRVIPTPQGTGLLTLGGLGLSAGLTLVPLGAWTLGRGGDPATSWTMLGIGAVAGGVVAPLSILVGQRLHATYMRTGGWKRRPIPELRPAVSVGPQALTFAVSGSF